MEKKKEAENNEPYSILLELLEISDNDKSLLDMLQKRAISLKLEETYEIGTDGGIKVIKENNIKIPKDVLEAYNKIRSNPT